MLRMKLGSLCGKTAPFTLYPISLALVLYLTCYFHTWYLKGKFRFG